jgi:cell division protein ZipA
LSGDKALKVLLKYGLRFGEMSCFHRYENTDEPSPLMFSVLRVTDNGPAGFDLGLSGEQVQGLAFFLIANSSCDRL